MLIIREATLVDCAVVLIARDSNLLYSQYEYIENIGFADLTDSDFYSDVLTSEYIDNIGIDIR